VTTESMVRFRTLQARISQAQDELVTRMAMDRATSKQEIVIRALRQFAEKTGYKWPKDIDNGV